MNCSKKVQVRLSDSVGFMNVKINLQEFKIVSNFSDEIFGFYQNHYICLKKHSIPEKVLTFLGW